MLYVLHGGPFVLVDLFALATLPDGSRRGGGTATYRSSTSYGTTSAHSLYRLKGRSSTVGAAGLVSFVAYLTGLSVRGRNLCRGVIATRSLIQPQPTTQKSLPVTAWEAAAQGVVQALRYSAIEGEEADSNVGDYLSGAEVVRDLVELWAAVLPPRPLAVASVTGANQVREDRRNRHEEGICPEGRHGRRGVRESAATARSRKRWVSWSGRRGRACWR